MAAKSPAENKVNKMQRCPLRPQIQTAAVAAGPADGREWIGVQQSHFVPNVHRSSPEITFHANYDADDDHNNEPDDGY